MGAPRIAYHESGASCSGKGTFLRFFSPIGLYHDNSDVQKVAASGSAFTACCSR